MDFIETFRDSLKIPTFWTDGTLPGDAAAEAPLLRFQQFLVEKFPAFHKQTERWVLNPYSVLYRWPGENGSISGSADNDAVLFLAHYDVVPAEKEKWSVDPFGAEVKDGYIYGRGSIDMKSILISIMESAEQLSTSGFKPKRDIWFAFGGDEERTAVHGAQESSKWLEQRGVKFSWILDEGTPIAEDHIKEIKTPVALVSVAEKGYLSLELSVAQEPGHASMPPRTQAAAVLARALCRIAQRPFPYRLCPTMESFFKQASFHIKGIQSFAMRHARALGSLFFKVAGASPSVGALLRTTVAMTQLEGSAADNVMPSQARSVINLRLLEPWTVESAIEYIKKTINDDRVTISIFRQANDMVSPNAAGYQKNGWPQIQTALQAAWPGVPLLPFLMAGGTDSRHYKKLADSIFRFSPHKLNPKEISGVHGHDERLSEENLLQGLKFYTKLMEAL